MDNAPAGAEVPWPPPGGPHFPPPPFGKKLFLFFLPAVKQGRPHLPIGGCSIPNPGVCFPSLLYKSGSQSGHKKSPSLPGERRGHFLSRWEGHTFPARRSDPPCTAAGQNGREPGCFGSVLGQTGSDLGEIGPKTAGFIPRAASFPPAPLPPGPAHR